MTGSGNLELLAKDAQFPLPADETGWIARMATSDRRPHGLGTYYERAARLRERALC
jgi:hypothetical protein